MNIDITEKARWVSDLIHREVRRFEDDTGVCVDDIRISKLDGKTTSVNLEIRSLEDGSRR